MKKELNEIAKMLESLNADLKKLWDKICKKFTQTLRLTMTYNSP